MKKTCGIYKITSPTGKIYIGQSVFIEKRKSRYKNLKCKGQFKLIASLSKHGFENHKFEIIIECTEDSLNYWEIYYIKFFDTYNTTNGLNLQAGGCSTRSPTKETRERMSISQKMRYLTYEHPNKNRPFTDEQRDKLRNANTGKKHSENTKIKMSVSAKGKKRSAEHQEKLSSQRRGKPPRTVKCNYCDKEISFLLVNRWHNENCKNKTNIKNE